MKRMLWMVLLTLALPLAAFASTGEVDFTNTGGTLSGSNAGLSLTGSVLTVVNGYNGGGLVTGNLGTVSFTTAALVSGDLQNGGIFGPGGTFVITSPSLGGTLFSGTFTGPVKWVANETANGQWSYTLTGALSGTWSNGTTVFGATAQLTVLTGQQFSGSTGLASGDTTISTTPEPGSLTLMGSGLVGLAGLLRRKLKA